MEPTVSVIGLGYIGLPTALMFAASGVRVVGVDKKPELLATLKAGRLAFEEEGLPELFERALKGGITFSETPVPAGVYIIAVPTPYEKRSKKVDASFVVAAVREAAQSAPENAVIVIESTIPPGTVERYIRPIAENCGKTLHLCHAPERIIPGRMIHELKTNPRTIGADSPAAGERVRALYSRFCEGEIILTDIRTAEMTKVVENTYRDCNIAFANELLKICREANLDVYEIIRIANRHPRVDILSPGPGVGGHCISVDPWFLIGDYPGLANLILTARNINDSMPGFVLSRIRELMAASGLRDPARVGIYGLTYKENVDDTRESPALQLIESMERHLASPPPSFDPFVREKIVENQFFNFDRFLGACDLVVVLAAHTHIKENVGKLSGKAVLDTRNCGIPGAVLL